MDQEPTVSVGQSSKKSAVVKLVFIVLTLAVIVAALTFYFRPKSPSYITTNFMNYVLSNDATDAYDLTSPAFQQSTPLSSWTSNVRITSEECTGTVSLKQTASSSDSVKFAVNVTNKYGTCNMQVNLVKSGRNWRVDYFNPAS